MSFWENIKKRLNPGMRKDIKIPTQKNPPFWEKREKHICNPNKKPDYDSPLNIQGYIWYPCLDSSKNDLKQIPNVNRMKLAQECSKIENCVGFNTNGWLKKKSKRPQQFTRWTGDVSKGYYMRRNPSISEVSGWRKHGKIRIGTIELPIYMGTTRRYDGISLQQFFYYIIREDGKTKVYIQNQDRMNTRLPENKEISVLYDKNPNGDYLFKYRGTIIPE